MQRYSIEHDEFDDGQVCFAIVQADDGDYVLYKDYEKEYQALWRECETLAKENKRLRGALERIYNDKFTLHLTNWELYKIAKEALEG